MLIWMEDHETLIWALSALSIFTFFATLIAVPLLIARVPADYFTRRPVKDWPAARPMLHLSLVMMKNVLGLLLLLGGLAMLVLPGQGLLTILVAIMLLDFPGKRRLEGWLIRRRALFRAANWIRAGRGRPPLELPETNLESRR